MYYEIYSQQEALLGVQWRWRLKSANHEKLASGEGYSSKQGCLHVIGLLMDTNRQTLLYEVQP